MKFIKELMQKNWEFYRKRLSVLLACVFSVGLIATACDGGAPPEEPPRHDPIPQERTMPQHPYDDIPDNPDEEVTPEDLPGGEDLDDMPEEEYQPDDIPEEEPLY